MQNIGNKLANDYYEFKVPKSFKRPNSNSSDDDYKKFVNEKYVRKSYCPPNNIDPVSEYLESVKKGIPFNSEPKQEEEEPKKAENSSNNSNQTKWDFPNVSSNGQNNNKPQQTQKQNNKEIDLFDEFVVAEPKKQEPQVKQASSFENLQFDPNPKPSPQISNTQPQLQQQPQETKKDLLSLYNQPPPTQNLGMQGYGYGYPQVPVYPQVPGYPGYPMYSNMPNPGIQYPNNPNPMMYYPNQQVNQGFPGQQQFPVPNYQTTPIGYPNTQPVGYPVPQTTPNGYGYGQNGKFM